MRKAFVKPQFYLFTLVSLVGAPIPTEVLNNRIFGLIAVIAFLMLLLVGLGVALFIVSQRNKGFDEDHMNNPKCFADNKRWFSFDGVMYYLHNEKVNL